MSRRARGVSRLRYPDRPCRVRLTIVDARRNPSVFCKQEVAGSMPTGSTGELPVNACYLAATWRLRKRRDSG